jgi:hypothetical protein
MMVLSRWASSLKARNGPRPLLEKLLEISFRANYAPSISELPQKVLKSKLRGFIKKNFFNNFSGCLPIFIPP